MVHSIKIAILVASGLLILAPPAAYGRDPDGSKSAQSTPQEREFFKGWKNKEGGSCCGDADCHREVDPVTKKRVFNWRQSQTGEGYEIQILPSQEWIPVPDTALSTEHGNPTGGAVACWGPWYGNPLYCFTPPISEPPPQ